MGKETNTTKLKMQRENGVKENGKMSYRTSGLPVRNDITREQCLSLIDSCESLTGWKVTKAYLEHKRTHEVLPPMTNVEKLEKEGEEVGVNTGRQSATVSSVQSSTAPASSPVTTPVQAPAAVLGEVDTHPTQGNDAAASGSNNLFPGLEPGNLGAETAEHCDPSAYIGMNFMDRMRANGFKVTLEEMPRSPFAHTVAQKGTAPVIKKLDVPLVYVEG